MLAAKSAVSLLLLVPAPPYRAFRSIFSANSQALRLPARPVRAQCGQGSTWLGHVRACRCAGCRPHRGLEIQAHVCLGAWIGGGLGKTRHLDFCQALQVTMTSRPLAPMRIPKTSASNHK